MFKLLMCIQEDQDVVENAECRANRYRGERYRYIRLSDICVSILNPA